MVIGLFVDQSYSKKCFGFQEKQNANRNPRYVWWNHYETDLYTKKIMELEEKLERLKEREQEKRNKIFRNKLVGGIKSSVLRDFWTSRY